MQTLPRTGDSAEQAKADGLHIAAAKPDINATAERAFLLAYFISVTLQTICLGNHCPVATEGQSVFPNKIQLT